MSSFSFTHCGKGEDTLQGSEGSMSTYKYVGNNFYLFGKQLWRQRRSSKANSEGVVKQIPKE